MAIIRERLGEQCYDTWFKDSRALPSDENFIIELKDSFALNWIKHNYNEFIADIVLKVAGNGKHDILYAIPTDGGGHHFESTAIQEDVNEEANLNPNFTFDHFIVGDFNKFAVAAAIEVAKAPSNNPYNPLYIHGGVGLGKTHLLQSIGHLIKKINPTKNVVYVTAEHYTDEFIGSLVSNSINDFKMAYRSVDVLLVDDIQFFSGKTKSQEQFFHLFNGLHQNGKQVVLTSEIPPPRLEGIAERLRSRFNWGLVVDLKPPGLNNRIQILRAKMERANTKVPDEVVHYLAENITSNIRALEGSLLRILAQVSLTGMEITLPNVAKLAEQYEPPSKSISIHTIIDLTCKEFGISKEDICGKSRVKHIALARQLAMYLARSMTDASLSYIGLALGKRDHSTVHHSCSKISQVIKTDDDIARIAERIQSQCNQ